MRISDRSQAARDGSRSETARTISDVEGDGFRGGRKKGKFVLTAEAGEVSKIRSVRLQGGGRLRAANIGFGFLNEGLKIARGRDQSESGFVHSMTPEVVTREGEQMSFGARGRSGGLYGWVYIEGVAALGI